jgi:hypothetical protein
VGRAASTQATFRPTAVSISLSQLFS